jgi:hypothetical protein
MDTYTKGVMTVIAICLVSITFQLSGTQAIKNAEASACLSAENYNIFLQTFNNQGKSLIQIWSHLFNIEQAITTGSSNITRAIEDID